VLFGAYAILLSFLALVVVASFLPNARLWGINHLAFYSLPVRLLAFLVMIVSTLPRVSRAANRWLDACAKVLTGRRRLVLAVLLPLVSLVLFIAFSSATRLLGDGLYTANNIERASKVDHDTFVKVMTNPYPLYPGTEMINLSLSRFAAKAFHVPPIAGVRVLNTLLGALLVLVAVIGYRPSGVGSRGGETALVALALLSGGIQVFFGYIEAYTPLIFFTGLYVLAVRRTVTQGASVWGPVACAVAATVMHLLGLILLPSLAFLALWVASRRETSGKFLGRAVVLAVATVAIPWGVVTVAEAGRFVLPLTSREHAYAVLSGVHLADVANELLLLFPGGAVLGGVAFVIGARELQSLRRGGGLGPIVTNQEFLSNPLFSKLLFAVFLSIPCVLFLLFFRPELGMARDWDLFAVSALGPCVVLLTFWERIRANAATRSLAEVVLPPVLVMTFILTASWIGINAHPARSAARFESILSYDRARAGYAYEALALFYKDRNDSAAEIRAWERAVEASPNPRYLLALGLRYDDVGEKEKAVLTLERCLRMRPNSARVRQSLAQVLYAMGRYEEVLTICEEGTRLAPHEGFYPFLMGKAYLETGRFTEALGAFDNCRRLEPPPEAANEISELLRSVPADVLEEHRAKIKEEKTP
jgi:Flp pilus assembly protein TadD